MTLPRRGSQVLSYYYMQSSLWHLYFFMSSIIGNCSCECLCVCSVASVMSLCATLQTVARQVHLSMEFPRQEYWSGLPRPSPGDLPIWAIKPAYSAWQVDSLPPSHLGSPMWVLSNKHIFTLIPLASLGGASGTEPTANAGDARVAGSIPGWGKSPGGEHCNPFQYSFLSNPLDWGAWQATVHGGSNESDMTEVT